MANFGAGPVGEIYGHRGDRSGISGHGPGDVGGAPRVDPSNGRLDRMGDGNRGGRFRQVPAAFLPPKEVWPFLIEALKLITHHGLSVTDICSPMSWLNRL